MMTKITSLIEETIVKLNVPVAEEIINLSALDQQAQRTYGQFMIAFQLQDTITHSNEEIVKHLKTSLSMALTTAPDLASTVCPVIGSRRNELELRLGPESGAVFRVVDHLPLSQGPKREGVSLPKTNGDASHMNIFIPTSLYGLLFAPHATCEDEFEQGLPGLLLQVNLMEGGLIIGLTWHHTICDLRSVANFLRQWSGYTKLSLTGGDLSSGIDSAWKPSDERWRLEYGDHDADVSRISDYAANPSLRAPLRENSAHLLDRPDPATITASSTVWYFDSSSLRALRNSIAESRIENASELTQSEALSALIWKHVSRARLLDTKYPPEATSLFSTRIDYRGRMKPAFDDYFVGNINEPNARVRLSIREVCSASTPDSLAVLGQAIRIVTQEMGEDAVRTFIGAVNRLPKVTDLSWDYDTYPGPDLTVTDLSSSDMLRQDWGGPLNHATFLRAASREKGLVCVLPQDRDGGLEVQIQCEHDAVERLRDDPIFAQYADLRG